MSPRDINSINTLKHEGWATPKPVDPMMISRNAQAKINARRQTVNGTTLTEKDENRLNSELIK